MSIAYWCVLVAGLLPYLFVGLAKGSSKRGYNNRVPRLSEEQMIGWRQRAVWAHANGFEVFPLFAAAVIIAQLAGAAQSSVNALAVAFIVARLAHGLCYMADWHWQRSLVWAAGMGCVIALFVEAANVGTA